MFDCHKVRSRVAKQPESIGQGNFNVPTKLLSRIRDEKNNTLVEGHPLLPFIPGVVHKLYPPPRPVYGSPYAFSTFNQPQESGASFIRSSYQLYRLTYHTTPRHLHPGSKVLESPAGRTRASKVQDYPVMWR